MFSKPKSHSNGNLLKDHLYFSGKLMYERCYINDLKEFAFILGICHDFGKFTTFFQKEKINKTAVYGMKSRHSLISIHFTASFLKHIGFEDLYVMMAILVINHHSNLQDISSLITDLSDGERFEFELHPQIDDLRKQIKTIKSVYDEISDMFSHIDSLLHLQQKLNDFDFCSFLKEDTIKSNRKLWRKIDKKYRANYNTNLFFSTSYLYSLLIFADRNMASKLPDAYFELTSDNNKLSIPYNCIESKVSSFNTEDSDIRQILFNRLNEIESSVFNDNTIFTITAPTGSGKTLSALNFAFKLMEKTSSSRIVYALPLTSIIEQNHQVLRDIFKNSIHGFKINEYNYLIKHHYLAQYKVSEDNSIYSVLKHIESWNSKVIFTSFIQIFYAFGSNKASFLYRFSALNNSILLIDEPQVLSPVQWLMMRKMLVWLTENLNIRIILMTATKPLIFDKEEALELTSNIDFKYHIVSRGSRHQLVSLLDSEVTLQELPEVVFRKYKELQSKTILIVCNTKNVSIKLFESLQEKFQNEKFDSYYLSTNLLPVHRQNVINDIKLKIENNKKVILVSTQCIEAGVDLDFELGFRELAPFDSIIQTAGRINREYKRNRVENLFIVPDNCKGLPYHKEYLNITLNIFQKYSIIPEQEFEAVMNIYFENLKSYHENRSKELCDILDSLNFKQLGDTFKIIDEILSTEQLFIEYDKEAFNSLEDYQKKMIIYNESNNYEEKIRLRKEVNYLRRKLNKYIINISQNASYNFNKENGILLLEKSNISIFYNFDNKEKKGIGFREPDNICL